MIIELSNYIIFNNFNLDYDTVAMDYSFKIPLKANHGDRYVQFVWNCRQRSLACLMMNLNRVSNTLTADHSQRSGGTNGDFNDCASFYDAMSDLVDHFYGLNAMFDFNENFSRSAIYDFLDLLFKDARTRGLIF